MESPGERSRGGRHRIAEIEPIIPKIAARVIGRVSPISGFIGGETIGSENLLLAQERNGPGNIGSGSHCVYNCRLDIIFARDPVRIERDLVIRSAPLAEVDRVAEGDVHDGNLRSVLGNVALDTPTLGLRPGCLERRDLFFRSYIVG